MVTTARRVAWVTAGELQLVFYSLFERDTSAQLWAINRIKVWLARGNCPHAAESTASLMEIVLRDTTPTSSSARSSHQELRLSYSMALIRFVNTIVDPLQTTYFARSIASLAAQLGLPLWFVELRHAATHEDLPSISVLRDASRQALDWLYTNYWLPTISPSSSPVALLPLDPLRTLLKSYKLLTKTTLRDSSKLTRSKAEFLKVYKGIDKWMTEASGLGRGRERALEGLVEALVEVGALVPLAKKKRPTARNMELGEGGEIWGELLGRLEETYEGFADLLVGRLVELLCLVVIPDQMVQGVVDRSYEYSLTAWILSLLRSSDDPVLTESVVKTCLIAPTPSSLALLDVLAKFDEGLSGTIAPLLLVLRNSNSGLATTISNDDMDSKLNEMEQRLRDLDRLLSTPPTRAATPQPERIEESSGRGWKLVPKDKWKGCPIGALPGGKFEALDLVE